MKNKFTVRDLTYMAFFAALTTVLGYVSIPLSFLPAPITGQTLSVMLAGSVLSPLKASVSMMVFVLLGAIGLPVFAGATGGIGIIFGPRGGFILSWILAAAIISIIRGKNNKISRLAIGNIVGGIIVVYLIGIPWMNLYTNIGFGKIFVGSAAYLPGDFIKVFLATIIGYRLNIYLKNRH